MSSDDSQNEQHLSKHDAHHHHLSKQEKKKKQREKNRRDWIFFRQAEELRENVDIKAPTREVKQPERPKEESKEKLWSSKLSTIRNRLDNSKRVSDDRWNRFAGTTDGGGRGR